MRDQNGVLHRLLQLLPWSGFDRLVAQHKADRGVRRRSTRSQLVAMLYAQLAGAASLREIVTALASHRAPIERLGARPVARPTLADANAHRPAAGFTELPTALVAQARRGLRRELGALHGRILRRQGARGARPRRVAAAPSRRHAGADERHHGGQGDAARGRCHPRVRLRRPEGRLYVFDLGHCDYGWWARLATRGCRIVTRLESNTPLRVTAERPVAADGPILSDRIGFLPHPERQAARGPRLPARQAAGRRNPFQAPVREIRVRTAGGKVLRLVSNDLAAPAATVAALHERRWAIELLFRWLKQTLKIKHLLGVSANAVRIQIATALIAHLLLRLAQQAAAVVASPLTFCRLIRANLMQRRPLDQLLPPPLSRRQIIAQPPLDGA